MGDERWKTNHGVTHIVECDPGKALARMVKQIASEMECGALSDKAACDRALAER